MRNRNTENRLCLLLSSCIGGVFGRLADEARCWVSLEAVLSATWLETGVRLPLSPASSGGGGSFWRRMSDLLGVLPRRRRKGMMMTDHDMRGLVIDKNS